MKKIIINVLLALFFAGCGTSQQLKNVEDNSQTINPDVLTGKQKREALTGAPHNLWFVPNYQDYQVNSDDLASLTPLLKGIEIKVFMGTWCGDSKRETPRFYKIMDAAGVKDKDITLITMNRSKKTPENFEEGLNITNVPTFIFYRNGKEINRIVEYPIQSLEKDMIAILKGTGYKHAYEE